MTDPDPVTPKFRQSLTMAGVGHTERVISRIWTGAPYGTVAVTGESPIRILTFD